MISTLRRAIALVVALVVTVLTLGRLELSWSGKRGGHQHDHHGGPAATRVVHTDTTTPDR